MQSITTIPKKISQRGELVVLPKDEYEKMLRIVQKKSLDYELSKAIKEYKSGKFFGPFDNAKDGLKFIKSRKPKR
jgi:hypothetical protein